MCFDPDGPGDIQSPNSTQPTYSLEGVRRYRIEQAGPLNEESHG